MKRRYLSLLSLVCIISICLSCVASTQIVGAQYSSPSVSVSSSGKIAYSSNPSPKSGILSPLHVEGTHLKDAEGNIVILRGFIYSSVDWFSGSPQYFSANQLAYMKQWGGNVVSVNLKCEPLEDGIAHYGGPLNTPSLLTQLDNMVNWAQSNDLYVILRWLNDGHIADGTDRNIMNVYMNYFGYSNWLNMWQTLAARYSGRGLLYCLAGEPLYWSASTAQSQMQAARDAITLADPTAIVVCPEYCEANWGTTPMSIYLSYPITGSNVIYAFDDYAYHFLSNAHSAIQSQALVGRGAQALLDAGKCVFVAEFGAGGNGLDYNVHQWTDSGVTTFSAPWLNNFMAALDNGGYSGYVAWSWGPYTSYNGLLCLLSDWNGNPNGYGTVIKNYYSGY
jgi:hypothetical protein